MATLVLLHSPFTGPLTWQPVAARLREHGHRAEVPSFAGILPGGPPYHRRLAESVRATGEVVLVGHSSAGTLLPAIAEALEVRAAIYVDATLPHPGASWFDSAPPERREQLLGLARNGLLPRWHEWFPPEMFTGLLPDEGLRDRFVAELEPTPLAYLEEAAPVVAAPPSAYLQLSEPYAPVADEAGRRGWPVLRERADHLAMLTNPDRIAGLLHELVQR
ncbi:alpha/beta fold hydrolase [Amycolatopsis nigrescens]|uniref:alpha/beta fold hydrolase n=1 Tax=Amycolatopsis nigrescens TaxID=381445 RepID=UPI0003799964|nr:alpha/beta fold hydrolase [Amycolatopsis nigrescens]